VRVEFLSYQEYRSESGIGRYVLSLVRHLSGAMDVALCRPRFLPLSERLQIMRNLPAGIHGHQRGSIVHFPQIMGCALMLYRPYHPAVATVHDLGFLELPAEREMWDLVARQLLRLSLAGLKRVDWIVADSDFTRDGVIKHLGVREERVVTIYPGVDDALFRPIPDARMRLISSYPGLAAIASEQWMLYVGSELPRKNLGTLLRAVALVREVVPGVRLLKVGAAGGAAFRRQTLRIVSDLGLVDHVLIFEGVPEEALPLFYSAANLFVTASKLEGFGFPVLEAMACGAPVACSRAGALPEVAGDAVWYFPVDEPDAIARVLLAALAGSQSGDSQKGTRPGIERSSSFRWQVSAKTLASLYSLVATVSKANA
jgi:glycosyltransferase involved in cell wall biosynthesis